MTDPESLGQFLRHQMLPSLNPTVKDIGQQRLDNRVPTLTMIAIQLTCRLCHDTQFNKASQKRPKSERTKLAEPPQVRQADSIESKEDSAEQIVSPA
jgi:hypothetical protein